MNNKMRENKKNFSPPLKVNSYKVNDLEFSSRVGTTVKIENQIITEDLLENILKNYPTFNAHSESPKTEMNETTKTFNVAKDKQKLILKDEHRLKLLNILDSDDEGKNIEESDITVKKMTD